MEKHTLKIRQAQALDEINRQFYDRFADQFHQTRSHAWTGWRATATQLPTRALRVLDIGCGNGRLAQFLQQTWCEHMGHSVELFHGLERCATLLEHAQTRALGFDSQWTQWSWSSVLDQPDDAPGLPPNTYDWVTLFGVMHHVYGYERRLNLLKWAARYLAPGGVLTVSLWDFGAHAKWDKKQLPWADYCDEYGINSELIEPGDFLLGWSGKIDTPRYCHWVSREEEARMLSDLAIDESLNLGPAVRQGDENDLNRYWAWVRNHG